MDSFGLSPFDVANWFVCNVDREAGDSITHLKLQKLLYYAQAWTLVLKGKPLFDEDFEAWAHGPVLRTIYDSYKGYGFEALPSCSCENDITDDVAELLGEVDRVYGEKNAKYLEALTHSEIPWKFARGSLSSEERCNAIISKESMKSFYAQMLEQQ
jgi:uncharacterized phage-associated protein